jgi:hypothetical protein
MDWDGNPMTGTSNDFLPVIFNEQVLSSLVAHWKSLETSVEVSTTGLLFDHGLALHKDGLEILNLMTKVLGDSTDALGTLELLHSDGGMRLSQTFQERVKNGEDVCVHCFSQNKIM